LIVEVIGCVDEANTFLGLANSFIGQKKLKEKVMEIQKHLFEIGAILAGAKLKLDKDLPKKMEREIDEMDKALPILSHFILPGGGKGASLLFMARTFVRRLERRIVSLSKKKKLDPGLIIYLNRLSDYIFTLARYLNFKEREKEEIWKP
jgi:cob(I)alamin adenosyltransferase